jgi:DNA-binding GntR family transcriptional regulator
MVVVMPALPNLKEAVMATVRDRIFAGELKPGQKVDQDELAQQLRVSKIPVREALITLESAGLVVNLPRRGAYVAELTRDDINDTFHLFGAVSAIAARRAATSMSDQDIADLESLLGMMRSARDMAEFAPLNNAFHARIHKAGSRRMRSILRSLSDGIPSKFFESAHGWHAKSDAEHAAIVKAIRAHDPQSAHDRTLAHFARNGELAIKMLEDREFWPSPDGAKRKTASGRSANRDRIRR